MSAEGKTESEGAVSQLAPAADIRASSVASDDPAGPNNSLLEAYMKDRECPHVAPPAVIPLTDEQFYAEEDRSKPNLAALKRHFMEEGRLKPDHALHILRTARELLATEPNCLTVPAPVNICGDIHGQYYDLMKLLTIGGSPESTCYLFLGDYVDRGYYSIECLLYLLSLKLWHPKTVFMLRGNHECKHLTDYFTFRLECRQKYGTEEIYEACLDVFNALPLAAVVNHQFFCVHGGISPEISSIDDINKIRRFQEPPTRGPFCDLLWSDPAEDFDREPGLKTFTPNKVRGCSYYYNMAAVSQFLDRMGLMAVVRAHEAQDAGYRMYKKHARSGFPAVITVFSAPNYVDTYKNKGAILKYDGNVLNIRQFAHSPHPYALPKLMDAFTWSVPFVGDKVMDLLLAVLGTCSEAELADAYVTPEELALQEAASASATGPAAWPREATRNKILAVAKMARVYAVLRTERESIMELKGLLQSDRLPSGTLALGQEGIRKAIMSFEEAKKCDLPNEHLPPLPGGTDAMPPPLPAQVPGLQTVMLEPSSVGLSGSPSPLIRRESDEGED